jgi:hypothetical protein
LRPGSVKPARIAPELPRNTRRFISFYFIASNAESWKPRANANDAKLSRDRQGAVFQPSCDEFRLKFSWRTADRTGR